jgi:CDP-diacylglycerol--glycerol-3-phosphate 3-phosphatidyltransferase
MLLIQPLARLGVTPNMLTGIGLLLSIITAAILAQGFFFAGGLLVLFAGVFDMFDGAMARVRNAATTFGAFLDSTLDRYSESIILFGLLLYALSHGGLANNLWPLAHQQIWMIALIYIAGIGSLMVSYTKARAEGLGLECRTGLLARPERVIILAIGLLTGLWMWALLLLAVFSNVTAVERMVFVWRMTARATLRVDAQTAATQAPASPQQDTSADTRHPPHLPMTTGSNEALDTPIRPMPTRVPPFNGGGT